MKNISRTFLLLSLILVSVKSTKAQCQSGYTYLVSGGMVQFSDSSSGTSGPVSYFWDFGNGDTANVVNPSPPLANGDYNVCLTIADSICTNTFCDTVVVGCTANFTFTDNGGGSFSFVNMSTGGFTSENWDFGDGQSSSPPIYPIVHNYAANGTYTVTVTIWDSLTQCNNSTSLNLTVVGASSCGIPNFTYIDNTDGSVSFFNSSTNASSYLWDFGNGNTSTQTNPTFYFQPAGIYSVCLTINDSCANVFCDSIVVTDTAGTACSGAANFTFTDNGGGSISFTNNSGVPTNYSWNFGDGSNGSSQASPTYTYATDASYLVILVVLDSVTQCTESYSQVVVVSGAANVCNLVSSFNTTDNGNGNWAFSSTSIGQPTDYSWNFGDGIQGSGQMPNHVYNTDGVYVVVLTVFDSILGCSNSANSIISVSGASGGNPCNSAFVVTYDSIQSTVLIYNTSTGVNLNYYWEFGDGNSSTQQNPNYTYAGNGPYGLCLTVDDGNGCTSTYCDSIFSGGTVQKQTGFSIAIIRPLVTNVVKVNSVVSDFMFFPNPVKDELTIQLELKEQAQVEITVMDLLGNTISVIAKKEMNAGSTQLSWSATNVPNGIYLLNIKSDNSLQVKKIVVNK